MEKKAWNWEKYVSHNVKYDDILENLMKYKYQGLDPGTKAHHLLNGIRWDKLSIIIFTARAHPDKYDKDFDALVTYLSQYI